MRPDTILCWKWTPRRDHANQKRYDFSAQSVNTLFSMIRRHYPHPFRAVCVTDDAAGLDRSIEALPLWNEYADVASPHGGRNPSCYRRLRLFHPDAAQWFGQRYVSLDLDAVITGDLSALWDRPEDAVFWGDTNPLPGSHYNGSMMLLTAGARPHVWNDFDPIASPRLSLKARCFGSDQGWISYRLGGGEKKWTRADGVYSYRNEIAHHQKRLPENARIVFFHGEHNPWHPYVQENCPWVREMWH